ncbi:zinc finger protein 197-like isoform X4 [Portunus trituberculatus]|nr:zinc finger protein 197-like isoform X4 [Portunus trituberculatus]
MASEEKILQVGEAQETPQAITITIVDPSALGSTSLDPSLVAQGGADQGSIVMVSGAEDSKAILQTVTETHMGTEELPIISNISNPEEEEMIVHETKLSESFDGGGEEGELGDSYEDVEEPSGPHCLVCNIDLTTNDSDEQVPVFKTQTSTTQRKVAVFLSSLIGQKVTSRKAHSDILCRRCFSLLDRVDSLEVEIRETKEEIINKYQETVSVYGGRARRIKPATAKKPDYVFPKVEPEDEADQLLDMELDGNFEPQVEDLMDEDPSLQDDDWEPKFKRPRIKKESTSIGVCESSDPPKRKRGRPRKDLTKAKELDGEGCIAAGEDRLGCSGKMETETCIHCEEEVPTTQLMNHVQNHENKQYSCPFCPHMAARLSLSQHLQEKHQENFLTCSKCSLKFIDSKCLDGHRLTHINGDYPCENCDVKFGTSSELCNHRNLEHKYKEGEENSCPLCKKIFHVRSKFVTHIIKFHRGKVQIDGLVWGSRGSLVCDVCQKVFKKASLYLAHEKTHKSKTLCCHYCENTYSSQGLLQGHILTHLFGDYGCSECSVKFASKHQLGLHEGKVHRSAMSKTCEYCHKEFRDQMRLICHRRKDHPESEESHKAKYCCSECGMKFAMRGNLVRHFRVHERDKNAKPPICNVCGKVLANKYSLATHMRTHSRDTYSKCDICDKAFVSKYTLIDHMRRIHEEFGAERDKVCEQCGRSFFTNTELKYHVKSHTGERPYRCDMCGETYLSSSALRYHMQKHSNIMFVCPKCKAEFENYVGWSTHMKRVHGITRVRDYTRQHGVLQVVMSKEPPSYSDGQNDIDSSLTHLIKKNSESAPTLAVGLEETVVSVPGKTSDVIQVVTYNDAANPLVHTVNATEVGLSHPRSEDTDMSHPNLPSETGLGKNHMAPIIEDEWEIILPEGCEDVSVISEEWAGREAVSQGGPHQFVLTGEWEGSQLIVAEEGEESRVGMTGWKGVEH